MLINALKSQKTSSDLDKFQVDDWKKNRVGIDIMYKVSYIGK